MTKHKSHLERGRTAKIADNLTADDVYWTGRDGAAKVDENVAFAYSAELALREILKPIIDRHPIDGAMSEGRMSAALAALTGRERTPGRDELLRDEQILFEVGQHFHRQYYSNKSEPIQVGRIIRTLCIHKYPDFQSKTTEERKSIIKNLREKFNKKMDEYCSVGSALSDQEMRDRKIAIRVIVRHLKTLGIA